MAARFAGGLLAGAVALCSGGEALAGGGPCSLLSPSDVGSALRLKGVRATAAGAERCTYRGSGAPDMLIVELHRNDKLGWDGLRAGNAMIGAGKAAPAIGDGSLSGAMGQVLYVRKGNDWFGIDMRGVMRDSTTVAPALARKAAARL